MEGTPVNPHLTEMVVEGLRWAALGGAAKLPGMAPMPQIVMHDMGGIAGGAPGSWRVVRPLEEALAELRLMHAEDCRESEVRCLLVWSLELRREGCGSKR